MKKLKHKTMIGLFTLIPIAVTLSVLPNFSIAVTPYQLNTLTIPDSFEGFKIVQISDLHNDSFGNKQSSLIKKIQTQSPDLIVITGDLIDSSHPDLNAVMDLINGIKTLSPIYFISGNHEERLDSNTYETLKSQLRNAGVIVLENEIITLQNEQQESIKIIGLRDNASSSTLNSLIDQLDPNDFSILLAHHPERFEIYAANKIDLIFSGHAHGGQVRIPLIGALIAPDQGFFPKYTQGLYKLNQSTMVVSRGLGNSVVPIRFFNGPELVTLTLRKS